MHLPQDVIDMIQHTAAEQQETPDQIVAEALRFSLRPIYQEATRRLKRQIRQQQSLETLHN